MKAKLAVGQGQLWRSRCMNALGADGMRSLQVDRGTECRFPMRSLESDSARRWKTWLGTRFAEEGSACFRRPGAKNEHVKVGITSSRKPRLERPTTASVLPSLSGKGRRQDGEEIKLEEEALLAGWASWKNQTMKRNGVRRHCLRAADQLPDDLYDSL